MKSKYDIIVIGGGAAGMMAAGRAGALGASVLVIEKNDRLGKKLSITGGRRCNITNAEFDTRLFLDHFPEAKQFLYSPFSQFDVQSTFDFFEGRKLPIVIENHKRAFPESQNAEDVCRVLEEYIAESGTVDIILNADAQSFIVENGKMIGVHASDQVYYADKFIVATGGLAAPDTGSTGEWLYHLSTVGHTVADPNPNLAPLKTSATWVHKLAGLTLDNMTLRYIQDEKVKFKNTGRLLFTHFGISGPLVINSAYTASQILKNGPMEASIDLFPDDDLGSLDKRLVDYFEENKNKLLRSFLPAIVQRKLSDAILRTIPNIAERPIHSISKEERKRVVRLLKDVRFPITGTMGFEWAIVADGGVDPKEVHFKTMQSKLHDNLYLIGDTININRPSGGYSLQLCWTMGWIAGTHAAETP